MRLDLPTLERPANAISTPFIGGSRSAVPAAAVNCQSAAKSLRPASISAAVKRIMSLQRGCGQPEHLAGGFRGVEPEEIRLGKALPPAPDGSARSRRAARRCRSDDRAPARESAARCRAHPRRLRAQAAAHAAILLRQARHAFRVHVGRIAEDDVVDRVAHRLEQIAAHQPHAIWPRRAPSR